MDVGWDTARPDHPFIPIKADRVAHGNIISDWMYARVYMVERDYHPLPHEDCAADPQVRVSRASSENCARALERRNGPRRDTPYIQRLMIGRVAWIESADQGGTSNLYDPEKAWEPMRRGPAQCTSRRNRASWSCAEEYSWNSGGLGYGTYSVNL